MASHSTDKANDRATRKGYNEKTSVQPQGAFPPDAANQPPDRHAKNAMKKANAAKKAEAPEKKSDIGK